VLKCDEDGDGVGNSTIGFKLEGVVMNEGVDNTSTVASPLKSRTGEIGVKLELESIEIFAVCRVWNCQE
jgi:hypothetical protein